MCSLHVRLCICSINNTRIHNDVSCKTSKGIATPFTKIFEALCLCSSEVHSQAEEEDVKQKMGTSSGGLRGAAGG